MNKVYVIWHHVASDRISDAKEVVGVFIGDWQEADKVVDKLNAEDPDRNSWSKCWNYWKEEVETLK